MDVSIFDIQAEFCRAMGSSARLRILHLLRDQPQTVTEIARGTGLMQATVSRHMASLKLVGVVLAQRRGHEIIYRIADPKIGEVCDLVREVLSERLQQHSRLLIRR